jgi:hypothetical protein
MSSSPLKSRIKAGAIHLAVSFCIALVLVLLVRYVWYPPPLFDLTHVGDVFLVLVGCDVCLGPLLTLIIFDIRKPRPELVRDVAVIAIAQLAALVYGVSTLATARPAYVVYNAGQFNVPLANEMVTLSADGKSVENIPASPWFGPKLVGAPLPKEGEESNRILFSAVEGRGDIFQMPDYFVAYDDVRSEVATRSRDVEAIAKELFIPVDVPKKIENSYARKASVIRFLPLMVRKVTALAVVDGKTGDLLGIEAIHAPDAR